MCMRDEPILATIIVLEYSSTMVHRESTFVAQPLRSCIYIAILFRVAGPKVLASLVATILISAVHFCCLSGRWI